MAIIIMVLDRYHHPRRPSLILRAIVLSFVSKWLRDRLVVFACSLVPFGRYSGTTTGVFSASFPPFSPFWCRSAPGVLHMKQPALALGPSIIRRCLDCRPPSITDDTFFVTISTIRVAVDVAGREVSHRLSQWIFDNLNEPDVGGIEDWMLY